MSETGSSDRFRKFDPEDRSFRFAQEVRQFVRKLPRTICNLEDVRQVVRSSGSIGANYIEANEALSKKEFRLRIRIARKESKETAYWLRLLDTRGEAQTEQTRARLVQESLELMRILAAIVRKRGD